MMDALICFQQITFHLPHTSLKRMWSPYHSTNFSSIIAQYIWHHYWAQKPVLYQLCLAVLVTHNHSPPAIHTVSKVYRSYTNPVDTHSVEITVTVPAIHCILMIILALNDPHYD